MEEYLTKYYGSDEDEEILRASKRTEKFWKAFAAERKDGDEKVPSRFRRKKLPKSERRAVAGSVGAELAGASAHPGYNALDSRPAEASLVGSWPKLKKPFHPSYLMLPRAYSLVFPSLLTPWPLPLVLVDGYNVVGSWPKLKKPFHPSYLMFPHAYSITTDALPLVLVDGYNVVGSWPKLKQIVSLPSCPPYHPRPSAAPRTPCLCSTDALPLVLVDEYNVVGSWPKLKQIVSLPSCPPYHPRPSAAPQTPCPSCSLTGTTWWAAGPS
ncbi:unnamed protein product [Closterium sp. Naga37s-1]|nr:unnamed protein product [Closterium sp. Naga37s-1]